MSIKTMKERDITPRRYVAKVGRRTIVRAYRNGNGWSFRDERTNRFVSLTARRLWRPALPDEHCDSETIQRHSCMVQRQMWDGREVRLPIVWIDSRMEGAVKCPPRLPEADSDNATNRLSDGRRVECERQTADSGQGRSGVQVLAHPLISWLEREHRALALRLCARRSDP